MFATSDWESDVPKGDINFGKKVAKKKKSKKNISTVENQKLPYNKNITMGSPTKIKKFNKQRTSKQSIHSNNSSSKSLVRNGGENMVDRKFNKTKQLSGTFGKEKPKKELAGKKTANSSANANNKNGSVFNGNAVNTLVNKTRGMLAEKQRKFNENRQTKDEIKSVKNKKKRKKIIKNSKIESNSEKLDKNDISAGELKLSGDNPRKRKHNNNNVKQNTIAKKCKTAFESSIESLEISNFDSDMPDEVIIEKKKKILNEAVRQDDREDILFSETHNIPINKKKERLKKVFNTKDVLQRNQIKTSGLSLRARMLEKLKSAQFRYLNEKLYTSTGSEAQQLFQSDPAAFQTYHEGYQLQVKKWPVNPLDVIIKSIQKLPKTALIADMGCGEAKLAKRVQQKVRSFDLVACVEGVEACDMARTPLLTSSVDAAVYCLALMGTDLSHYLAEANRVLKTGGLLLIAEVESRFEDADAFSKEVQRLGFKLLKLDKSHEVFFFMEFKKVQEAPKKSKLPALVLKPCFYKRR